MRRLTIVILTIVMLATVAIAAGCGTSPQTAGLPPADILAAAIAASEDITSARGGFEVQVSFDVDTSDLPEEAMGLVSEPMKVTGTYAFGSDPQAGEVAIALSMAGQTMDLGMKFTPDGAWIDLMGNWYETPAEMLDMVSGPTDQEAIAADVERLLADLQIDPMNWMKDLTLVGEEAVDGIDAYHLAATPDLAAMTADVVKLMDSEALRDIIASTGYPGSDLAGPLAPDSAEYEEMSAQLEAMFSAISADMWIAKDSSTPLKLVVSARATPPPGEDSGGLNAIEMSVTLTLSEVNEPVVVEPPVSAEPWSEFEKAMEEDPGMFMGMLPGAMGDPSLY